MGFQWRVFLAAFILHVFAARREGASHGQRNQIWRQALNCFQFLISIRIDPWQGV
jgi:hypothetical protein